MPTGRRRATARRKWRANRSPLERAALSHQLAKRGWLARRSRWIGAPQVAVVAPVVSCRTVVAPHVRRVPVSRCLFLARVARTQVAAFDDSCCPAAAPRCISARCASCFAPRCRMRLFRTLLRMLFRCAIGVDAPECRTTRSRMGVTPASIAEPAAVRARARTADSSVAHTTAAETRRSQRTVACQVLVNCTAR